MSNPRSKEDNSFDLEQQFILRMPEEAARYLAEDIDLGVSFKVFQAVYSLPRV